jgi:hypothetical protein
MADKKYYTIDEAAAFLGITPAEINLRRERNELRGLRDGANWKFKAEDVESLARRIRSQEISAAGDDDTGEVLLSEVALGGSDAGTSGTVIGGKKGKGKTDSDLRLAESDVKLGGSGVKKPGSGTKKAGGSAVDLAAGKKPAPPAGRDDLDLTIDEELLLDDEVPLDDKKLGSSAGKKPASAVGKKSGSGVGRRPGDSAVNVGGRKLDDDDLVIGGSGSGSDVTIGSDSGISLVDPTDSGLSLEEPLELERDAEDDSLELGEDDMLTFSEEGGAEAGAEADASAGMRTEEGFQLTPLEEAAEEDSESGSQVIALEGAPVSDAAPTMIASSPGPMAAAMLDEDFAGAASPFGLGAAAPAPGSPLGASQPMYADQSGGAAVPSMITPEAPYTGLQVTSLIFCTIFLILCGMMGYELLRNMWSWNGAYTVNSALMDFVVGLFG